jgi:transposase
LLQANEGEDDETKFDTDTTKDQPKRKKLPEHLERINVLLNPDPKCPECDGQNFRKISDDISEILEYCHFSKSSSADYQRAVQQNSNNKTQ